MTEAKFYPSTPDEGDQARTAELKTFSEQGPEGPSGAMDHEQATMNKASAEVERRTKKLMLYNNLGYFESSRRVFQADPELAELYSRGYIKQ